MLGDPGPHVPPGIGPSVSGRSPVMTVDQRAAAFSNAARCEALIGVVKQRVSAYPAPPPEHPVPRNDTGAAVIPATLAVSVLGPAVGPSTQLPADATPLALVVAVAVPTVPPPVTVKVTLT